MKQLAFGIAVVTIGLLAACGGNVVVDGDSAGGGGGGGGGGGSPSVDQITSACSQACDGIAPPCTTNVDCTKVCATFAGVAATSDACATAAIATIDCLTKWSAANECTEECPAGIDFPPCFVSWCSQNPQTCAANMDP
jgi:hypothetical protein